MQEKARTLLALGPDRYAKGDALGLPDIGTDPETAALLLSGAAQLAKGHGLQASVPLTGLGIAAARTLLATFHFEIAEVRSRPRSGGDFLDELHAEHAVLGWKVTVYNLVDGR
ncbi:MAG: hypothetical protein HYZ28_18625 [Myxococcales bacterium]|nr:hypothetical protein [Myxococcales bacterium]